MPCYNELARFGTKGRITNMGDKSPKKAEKKKKKKETTSPSKSTS
jgi:hypothetical protein